jgi:hypothetical protein
MLLPPTTLYTVHRNHENAQVCVWGLAPVPLTPRPAQHTTPASFAAWDHCGWDGSHASPPLSKHDGAYELRPAQAAARGRSTNAARRHHDVQTGGGAGRGGAGWGGAGGAGRWGGGGGVALGGPLGTVPTWVSALICLPVYLRGRAHAGGRMRAGGTSCWKRLRMLRTKALKSLLVLRASTRDCTSCTSGSHFTTAQAPAAWVRRRRRSTGEGEEEHR